MQFASYIFKCLLLMIFHFILFKSSLWWRKKPGRESLTILVTINPTSFLYFLFYQQFLIESTTLSSGRNDQKKKQTNKQTKNQAIFSWVLLSILAPISIALFKLEVLSCLLSFLLLSLFPFFPSLSPFFPSFLPSFLSFYCIWNNLSPLHQSYKYKWHLAIMQDNLTML